MTDQEALAFCDELWRMVGDGPGDIPGTPDRLDKIAFQFRSHPNSYVREKANETVETMRYWRSARRWRQWGTDPSALRASLLNSAGKLRTALMSYQDRSNGSPVD